MIRLSARDSEAFARAIIKPARAKASVIAKFLDAHRRSQELSATPRSVLPIDRNRT